MVSTNTDRRKVKTYQFLKFWLTIISVVSLWLFVFQYFVTNFRYVQNLKQTRLSSNLIFKVSPDRRDFQENSALNDRLSYVNKDQNATKTNTTFFSEDASVKSNKGWSLKPLSVPTYSNLVLKRKVPMSRNHLDKFLAHKFIEHSHAMPSQPVRKVTVLFQGGLGNLMFQYAALVGIARKNSMVPVISKDSVIARVYFPSIVISPSSYVGERFGQKSENISCAFEEIFFSIHESSDIILHGYFQSWKYFNDIEEDLRNQFVFHTSVINEAAAQLNEILKNYVDHGQPGDFSRHGFNVTLIGVHVRLGDMAEKKHLVDYGYVTADTDYLNRAMEYFRQKYPKPVFVVASNRQQWCQQNLNSPDIYFLHDDNSREIDLAALSMCQHTIMTVGSFGWWAAWLTGGETVYYKLYPRPGSKLDSLFVSEDYRLPDWIGM